MVPLYMLVHVYRVSCNPVSDANPERGGLLDSDSAQTSLQKAKATAASAEGRCILFCSLYIGAVWTVEYGALTYVCRWPEDYAEEEHALFVWSSQIKAFSRL